MTTAPPPPGTGSATPRQPRVILGPLSVAAASGALLVVVGGLVAGGAAASGAAVGAVMVCLVFAFGAFAVGLVALVAPALSLLVALLTYTLQVVAVGLVYYGLSTGGALDGPLDARWLSAAVIACTLVWTATQVVLATRARQPIYDVPSQGAEASVR